MSKSRMDTFSVPVLGEGNAATITVAADVPVRVVVRNIGAVIVSLAHTSNELAKLGVSTGVYQMPPAAVDTFVLAPGQGLFVASGGAIGRICVAISEAWPFLGAQ